MLNFLLAMRGSSPSEKVSGNLISGNRNIHTAAKW